MTTVGFTLTSAACPDIDVYFPGEQLLDFAAADLDVVVSVLPNTPQTRQLLGARFFGALKPSTIFLSVGRGTVVDEAALVSALESKQLGWAVVDVFQEEPLP